MTEKAELIVIGCGPAGMKAAVSAADAGVDVLVIDAYPRPGGQYYQQIPDEFSSNDQTELHREAVSLIRELQHENITLLLDTIVWGIFPGEAENEWVLALCCHGEEAKRVQAKSMVIATGAYDRPIAFPGWTLGGVYTTGAVQAQLKSQRVLAGRKYLFSGTGPLQLATAAQVIRAGGEVACVLEGAPQLLWRGISHIPAIWGQWKRLREGMEYWQVLSRANVPYKMGWCVIEARGEDVVEEAVIARLDKNWTPIAGTEKVIAVDSIAIGCGLVTSTELSRMAGCAHRYNEQLGGFIPRRDQQMQTSIPGVYMVGDGAGIGGAEQAKIEGAIAGLSAALQLGKNKNIVIIEARLLSLKASLKRERHFSQMLGALFTPGKGLSTLADDDTIICRCEEIRLSEILIAISDGASNMTEIKDLTRSGMGNCQGRICGSLIPAIISSQTGKSIENIGPNKSRPPIHPIPMNILRNI